MINNIYGYIFGDDTEHQNVDSDDSLDGMRILNNQPKNTRQRRDSTCSSLEEDPDWVHINQTVSGRSTPELIPEYNLLEDLDDSLSCVSGYTNKTAYAAEKDDNNNKGRQPAAKKRVLEKAARKEEKKQHKSVVRARQMQKKLLMNALFSDTQAESSTFDSATYFMSAMMNNPQNLIMSSHEFAERSNELDTLKNMPVNKNAKKSKNK
uniref:BESS domain-containing protein n=1 Tax=Rhabditophanes sp. KR3021 TaxID=114890 RepID=A0AC35TY92_9BILA